jgi:hypothetical protein
LIQSEIEAIQSHFIETINDHPVMKSLDFMGFGYDMQRQAQLVRPYNAGMLAAIKKVYCRYISKSRVNSKAYKAASQEAFSTVDSFQASIVSKADQLEALRTKVYSLTA